MADEGVDWTGVSEPMVRQILAHGDMFLQAQLQSAIASDQRATTLAGMLATLSAAAFAAAVALWGKISVDGMAGLLTMAIFQLIAALCSAWAARPIDFFIPGSRPEQWYHACKKDLVGMIGGAAEHAQFAIDENEVFMGGNQEALRAGLLLAVTSPLLGALIWWLV
ncbi:hypothetical protein [Sphingomonas sp.]|uniref:hypothetical protein n=1 Tax=Sphingomonas sp. TaxID=28214 RepID=UPI0025EC400A|nr:hypothetical protein [Sphingomonas sp.]